MTIDSYMHINSMIEENAQEDIRIINENCSIENITSKNTKRLFRKMK